MKRKSAAAASAMLPSTIRESQQPTIIAGFDRQKMWDANDSRAISWAKTVAEFIVLYIQPFIVIQDVGFRRLMAKAEPYYKLPFRQTFSGKNIPDMYDAVMKKLKTLLVDEEYLSFTSDG